jgi:hypothetical protein
MPVIPAPGRLRQDDNDLRQAWATEKEPVSKQTGAGLMVKICNSSYFRGEDRRITVRGHQGKVI